MALTQPAVVGKVIQFVTFSSPNVGGHSLFNPWVRVTFSTHHPKKGTNSQNCQVLLFNYKSVLKKQKKKVTIQLTILKKRSCFHLAELLPDPPHQEAVRRKPLRCSTHPPWGGGRVNELPGGCGCFLDVDVDVDLGFRLTQPMDPEKKEVWTLFSLLNM